MLVSPTHPIIAVTERYATMTKSNAGRIRACCASGLKDVRSACTVAPEMRRRILLLPAEVGRANLVHHLHRIFRGT